MMRLFGVTDGALVRLGDDRLGPRCCGSTCATRRREEEDAVEAMLDVEVPTLQEMAEIEESSRLYREDGALIVTATVIGGRRRKAGRRRTPVTFVVTPRHLVSVRYGNPLPFRKTFRGEVAAQPEARPTSDLVFVALIDSIVERAAGRARARRRPTSTRSPRISSSTAARAGPRRPRAISRRS